MTTVWRRAFAVLWVLAHAYALIFAIVILSDHRTQTDPGGAASIIGFWAVGPLVILLVIRWVATGAWRFGPRW